LWFEGEKLYIDLDETEIKHFSIGSAAGFDRGTVLDNTLASLPGITSFEILVNGERGVMLSHYGFYYVAVIENSQIVDRVFYDIPEYFSNVNELNVQTAEEFLSQFITLFSFGQTGFDGVYRDWHFPDASTFERHLIWYDSQSGIYYDRLDNEITEAIYIKNGSAATGYRLYDLDNNGIPTIFINFTAPDFGGGWVDVFRFADGEYRQTGSLEDFSYRLFYDNSGNIVVLFNNETQGSFGYFYLDFTNGGMEKTVIAGGEFPSDSNQWSLWWEHHSSPEYETNPTIYGINTPLIPISAFILEVIR
jgi:hypothetical protein